ncbi:MAG TPA: helix-turn-helix transcriptional regulator [Candidatus Acidoferrales bacterium]|nr:helix-turn-helix transcriptional regulator [Candidatus Acidoferrales bacterium]
MSKTEKQLTEVQEILGKQITKLRESLGLSQEAFADKCGWDRGRESKIESGKYNLTLSSLIAIANASGMYLDINFSKK